MRPDGRAAEELRPVRMTRGFLDHAEGSALIEFGRTRVLCTASVEDGVPPFLKGRTQGWVTAEYGMLPRATERRTRREATLHRPSGRTLEIQRLIGRSLRAAVDLKALDEITITVDCDVIRADGGTRTAAITGGYIALEDAVNHVLRRRRARGRPLRGMIASVSAGIVAGEVLLDLDYREDSSADADMNIVMNDSGEYVEVQGTAEGAPFDAEQLAAVLTLTRSGLERLFALQREALGR